jgi:hypothetical protein
MLGTTSFPAITDRTISKPRCSQARAGGPIGYQFRVQLIGVERAADPAGEFS